MIASMLIYKVEMNRSGETDVGFYNVSGFSSNNQSCEYNILR